MPQFDPVGSFQRGRSNALAIQGQEQQLAVAPRQNALADLKLQQAKVGAERKQTQFNQDQSLQRTTIINQSMKALRGLPENQRASAMEKLKPRLAEFGVDLGQLPPDALTDAVLDNGIAATQGFISDPTKLTSAQRERSGLIKDIETALDDQGRFDPKKADAKAMSAAQALGLVAKAGTITGAERVATTPGLTAIVSESESQREQAKEFAKKTGASRASAIDKGFEAVQGIDKNIRNIDRAIEQIDAGANTGAIESRFFPSIKAASVALDQIQSELALDVVGATTFGALSEGELKLARDVALPTKLDSAELKQFLLDKKDAQSKLREYYREQMDFLDQGGTIAGFLRQKERAAPAQEQAQQALPQGISEDDISTTMQIHGMTREQVLERLGSQ